MQQAGSRKPDAYCLLHSKLKKMKKFKFILNDETKVNQYGFRVKNLGLRLGRFLDNPVVLDNHGHGNEAVIGRWENIQIEGNLLTAEAVFDDKDENAKTIAGKVERGFIKGASLGLDPFSMNNFQIAPDGVYDLIEAEVMEASIVAIPNNANALVKLYAHKENTMRELLDNEVSEILLMATDVINFKNNNQMKKVNLTLSAVVALGLPETTLEHEVETVNSKILELKANLDKANQKITAFEQLEKDKKAKFSANTVDADIKAGKIDATKRADFIKLHSEFPDLYKSTVTEAPAKSSLAGQILQPVGTENIKSFDDFEKLDLTAQLAFKEQNPEAYKKLFA